MSSTTPSHNATAQDSTIHHTTDNLTQKESTKDDAPKPPLSIVFTDIVKSTQLWEDDAQAMASAMQIHDSIVRSCTSAYSGYEVKQNGDGFMIAFPSTVQATRFCLDVQKDLLDAPWPKGTLKLKHGREVKESVPSDDPESDGEEEDKLLFRGLRLRMSAHWGDAVCVWNEVIGRMDYLGPSVNRAARFIQATEGGQIVVSETFLEDLLETTEQSNALDPSKQDPPNQDEEPPITYHTVRIAEQECKLTLLGNYEFDGVPDPQKLYFIVPAALHGRLKFWPRHKHITGSKGNLLPG